MRSSGVYVPSSSLSMLSLQRRLIVAGMHISGLVLVDLEHGIGLGWPFNGHVRN